MVPLLALTLAACGNNSGNLLGPIGVTTTASGTGRPGALLNIGFQFQPTQTESVHLLKASLIGVPSGLREVGSLVAVHAGQTPTHGVGALWGDLIDPWRTKGLVHPISDVTFAPAASDWVVVATVSSSQAGSYTTKGISLTYSASGKTYTQTFPFRIRLVADPNALPT